MAVRVNSEHLNPLSERLDIVFLGQVENGREVAVQIFKALSLRHLLK